MISIIFFSLILALITPLTYGLSNETKPIIAITQGVIKKDNVFPINIYWNHPNVMKGDQFWYRVSNHKRQYTAHFEIEKYTGIYGVPHSIVQDTNSLDEYCATILSKGQSFNGTCLNNTKIQWMYDRRDILSSFSFRDLVIPGTHQSAAYAASDNKSLEDERLISRWLLCQSKSIKSQLMDGIRYLDLRPGFLYENGRKKYIATHGPFNLILIEDAVRQINDFMDISKDIVIVSFKEFSKGFQSNEDHMDFIAYLEFSFAKHINPYTTWTCTMADLWQTDRRLIISYGYDAHKISAYMWPPPMQFWADAQTVGRLHSYMDKVHQNHKGQRRPFVAMMEFTHSVMTIAQDLWSKDMSLRHWAERLGEHIPQWCVEEWNATANIVAVDYYQTSGIVDIAIQLNEKRAADSSFIYHRLRPRNL